MIYTIKFTHYSLYYYANEKERKPSDCIIKISCYGDDKKLKEDLGGPVLTIKFFKDGPEIPTNKIVGRAIYTSKDEERIRKYGLVWKMSLNYPISQFNDIFSILRYYEKKPLYLFLDAVSLKGGISTTKEIVEDKEKEEKEINLTKEDP